MAQYIDKDALVAEIEKLKEELKASDSSAYTEAYIIGAEHTINTISNLLDTLEVKEVDLDEEIEKHLDGFIETPTRTYFRNSSKHFFELGLKAQKNG